ncbi:MAG: VWA domain-containing protein [Candidatus Aureabacteria bacterium]|nr:VWA domain-containing protein [Candidatus Auribacterota bacterium]
MIRRLFFIFVTLLFCCRCYAEENEGPHSPYFFVQSDDPAVDPFPLLETRADVRIAGIISEVKIIQVYKNEGEKTIEALYVFPLGVRSAIHGMKMKIGERIIEAKIEERIMAKKIYEDAKSHGQTASLLEQERPNVFQMNVANIMPGDIVEVTVSYTELLIPEEGVYEFIFPTVVGPRYHGEKEHDSDRDAWVETPYAEEGEEPAYAFSIKTDIYAGMPIAKVSSPSHKVSIEKNGKSAKVSLPDEEKTGGNRDFILRYSLQGESVQTGLLLYPGEEENFFLLMAQPPQKVVLKDVPPREYVFIVDVSGSMNGFPLDVSKELMTEIITSLRETDYFNILFFSGGSEVLSEHSLPATRANKEKALAMLGQQRGSGGTRILSALQKVFSIEKKDGLSRIVTIATDGYVSVEKDVFDFISENLGEGNFFSFGIGSSVNRYIIEGMARVGHGEPFIATNQDEAKKAAQKFVRYVHSPVLTDIELDFQGFEAYDVEPLHMPDLFAERPLVVFGKYKKAKGLIAVSGRTIWGGYQAEIDVKKSLETKENTALRFLWAREKIARLSDYGNIGVDVKDEVTRLGLQYSLMTDYTSFVAVDSVIRDTGEVVTVKQPLPLPQGVSNLAVGDKYGYGSVKRQSAPMMCLKEVYSGRNELKSEGIAAEKKKIPQVYLSGGTLCRGMNIADVENQFIPLKEKLSKLFEDAELTKLTVVLDINNGSVISVKVKSFEGKECHSEALEKIFKTMSFQSQITGQIELNILYL